MESVRILDFTSCKLDDAVIVQRILAGEKSLFEILLRRHNQRLFRVIRSYLKDTDEAQDVMQNTYLKAFAKLFQFRGDSSFATWLTRIGINEALLHLKDMKRTKTIYLHQDLNMPSAREISDPQPGPESAIIRGEGKRLFEQAIDNLPEKYRVVYMLREVEGLPPTEVCESLGITESNMKVRVHRAKVLLKDNLLQLSVNADVFTFGNKRCDAVVNFVMSAI